MYFTYENLGTVFWKYREPVWNWNFFYYTNENREITVSSWSSSFYISATYTKTKDFFHEMRNGLYLLYQYLGTNFPS